MQYRITINWRVLGSDAVQVDRVFNVDYTGTREGALVALETFKNVVFPPEPPVPERPRVPVRPEKAH